MRSVLVVDDDERLRSLVAEYLESRGFQVIAVPDGEQAIERMRTAPADLVVLDVMLPGKDGFEVCREVRKFSAAPIIMLTARGDETDRIVGLEIGADDYLPKPFNPRELLARINAILRRSTGSTQGERDPFSAGPIAIDPDRRLVTLRGEKVDLTTTEFEILRTLVANAGRVIGRERLMELARGEEFASFDRSIDVHISHIRRKLGDDPRQPTFVITVRGIGYTVPKDPT
ncbi:MAG: response regulator transcription factor [Deltaproteobacteria bacterium]|nr:response regulator transcription factor [Deltaproteobacteria bacterium]